ncbi:MAG: PKD domain-containing protein [Bacteroidetes bacterium]|nr:PKD domain-containing protein [Bacteroidota bacterium]
MKKVFTLSRFLFCEALIALFCFQTATAQEVKYKEKNMQITTHETSQMDEATIRKKMKEDGLFEPVIDKLLAQRKLWVQRGGNYKWSNATNGNCTPNGSAPCGGLGVESGWGAWQWQNGTNSGSNPPTWGPGPNANPATSPTFYNITSGAGIDCNTPGPNAGDPPIPVVCPGFGNQSIKIGDNCGVGSNCEQLTYPLNVTAQDTNFVFAYAIVIEDAGHLPNEQPYCEITIYDNNCNPVQCVPLIYTGGPSIPGFYKVNPAACCAYPFSDQYKPWTLVGVNLSQYVGQTLNVVITNCDCVYGGHFCYSYWDFLCGTASLAGGCVGNTATVCGPVDPNISYTYQWYVNGSPIPPPQGTQQCITYTSQPGDTLTVEVQQPSGCNFHLLYVPATVQPNFNFTGQCGTFTFMDSSTAIPSNVTITGWNWSFPGGNPTSATTSTATVTYPNAGNYSVTLTVTCSAGCTASITHTVNVNGLPQAAFTVTSVCAGQATTFTDASVAAQGDPIVSWSWSFPSGNPATSTSQNPVVSYPPGNYTASLTVTSQGGCTSTISMPVSFNPPPVANLSGNNVCFNNLTTFTDLSTGNNTISAWNWTMTGGNPSSSTSQNPTTTFGSPGTYTIMLVVTNNYGCKDSNVTTVVVNPLPVANFTYTPVCFGSCTSFADGSSIFSGSITGWSWNFGDPSSPSNTSTLQNPCHIFTAPNTYTVFLTVTSDSGCQSSTPLQVTNYALPVANFSSTAVCLNASTNFTDGSTSTVNAWSWNFGDPSSGNNTSALQNPSHVFTAAGNYTVTLIVTTPQGCKDTVNKPVTVYNPPVALFTKPDSGCSPQTFCFTDLSTSTDGILTNWYWNFPGGTPATSTAQSGCSSWSIPGTYGVQLIVTTQYGCKDTLFQPNYITIFGWPNADFCMNTNEASVNDPQFYFCPQWTNDVTQWTWDFGDGSPTVSGNSSNNQNTNPAHSYSAVATNNDFYSFNVCVSVQNVHGCYDSTCHEVTLTPEYSFYIPNCVTPNGDGINDVFFGKSRGVKDYNIWIFDRWGNMIYDCHYSGKNVDWDKFGQGGMSSACKWDSKVEGGNSNDLVQEDVYVWKVKLTDIFDKVHEYIGHVSVVK